MSTNILSISVLDARQSIEEARIQLSASINESQKIQAFDSLIQKISPLFQRALQNNVLNKELTDLLKETVSLLDPDPAHLELLVFTENVTAIEYIQKCAKCSHSVILRLFPNLNTLEQQNNPSIPEDTNSLKGWLSSIIQNLPKTNDSLDLFVSEIEKNFSSSKEKKILAYQILVANFSKNDQLQLLKTYVFAHKKQNALLAIEVFKIAIVQDAKDASEHIQDYGIDEQMIFEIIINTIDNNGAAVSLAVSKCIKNFKISKEEKRIKIAKKAAIKNGSMVAKFFQNFEITNEDEIIKIAKIAASTKPVFTSNYIQNFGIKNQAGLFSIFITALTKDLDVLNLFETYCFSEHFSELIKAFSHLKKGNFDITASLLCSFCNSKGWGNIQPLIQNLLKEDPHDQKIVFFWLAHFIGYCNENLGYFDGNFSQELSKEQFYFLFGNGLIKAVLDYYDPPMRHKFIEEMVTLTLNKEKKEFFKKISKNTHDKLPVLFLSSINALGVSEKTCVDFCKQFVHHHQLRPCKDFKKLKIFVNFLNFISQDTELEIEDKEHLLSIINSNK